MQAGIPESFQRTDPASERQPVGLQSLLIRRAALIRWASAALIVISLVLLMRTLPTRSVLESAQRWIDSLGLWGPVAMGVIYVVSVLLLIPGSMLTLICGAMYGLVLGTVIVWFAATVAAALAFLIARYVARGKVQSYVERSPRLAAVDEAIGEQGWKIVALLRLSPVVPFSLQNYLYGVTAIRFWPCVLTSWLAMLPGTFLYVYIGSLGKTAAAGGETSAAEWRARGVGLIATLAVTFYVARLSRKAIGERTQIEDAAERGQGLRVGRTQGDVSPSPDNHPQQRPWPWATLLAAALAVTALILALWATMQRESLRNSIERLLGMPPTVTVVELDAPRRSDV